MLADIKKKLKPGGLLYIDEALPKRQGQLHGICNKPMLTGKETIATFEKNGFEYVTPNFFCFTVFSSMVLISTTGKKILQEKFLLFE